MDYSFVAGRVEEIRARISSAAERSGRKAEEVELLAVTKFHPLEAADAAWEAGLSSFGESRVQEAESKFPAFLASHPEARLDMIGHLQSNKAKKAISLFSRIESVDSAALLLELDERAVAAGLCPEVLLELHTGEESKEGFLGAEELYRALELLLSGKGRSLGPSGQGGLVLRGLMTMAPNSRDESLVRASFRSLRAALEGARSRLGLKAFDVLSMGMSGDYQAAVEEGSTLLRIGTALFGEREA
jgi:pyridoxal phosphate enzyme (YggS family)